MDDPTATPTRPPGAGDVHPVQWNAPQGHVMQDRSRHAAHDRTRADVRQLSGHQQRVPGDRITQPDVIGGDIGSAAEGRQRPVLAQPS
ncbi:MAG: hypothetical protein ACRDRH_00650 [Pseudonocardia sp.]